MYSAVPPPGHQDNSPSATESKEQEDKDNEKPENVQEHQWKVNYNCFCEIISVLFLGCTTLR